MRTLKSIYVIAVIIVLSYTFGSMLAQAQVFETINNGGWYDEPVTLSEDLQMENEFNNFEIIPFAYKLVSCPSQRPCADSNMKDRGTSKSVKRNFGLLVKHAGGEQFSAIHADVTDIFGNVVNISQFEIFAPHFHQVVDPSYTLVRVDGLQLMQQGLRLEAASRKWTLRVEAITAQSNQVITWTWDVMVDN